MMRGVMMMNQQHQQNQHHRRIMLQQHLQPVLIVDESMPNYMTSAAASSEASDIISSSNRAEAGTLYPHHHQQQYFSHPSQAQNQAPSQAPAPPKKKRNLAGNPDPDAEVVALSPKSLLATNRFLCEICNKGFQRDQNLQLHRRGHNLPWKLKQRSNKDVRKKVYVCPQPSCVHHDPARALGDLTGIKKHFFRKHGEKKWKCDKCSKRYAVQSDWKAHSKTCGTREYRCGCGTLFSRRDSFITHRAFCDALSEETARSITVNPFINLPTQGALTAASSSSHHLMNLQPQFNVSNLTQFSIKREQEHHHQQISHPSLLLPHNHQNFNMMTRQDLPPWLACPLPPPSAAGSQHNIDPSTPPAPPPPMFNRSAAAATLQQQQADQEFLQAPHGHQNSNPNTSLGSTFPAAYPTPHMSATALLQKAVQMSATMSSKSCSSTQAATHHHQAHVPTVGSYSNVTTTIEAAANAATDGSFGLNLSSCEEMVSGFVSHGLNPFENKAVAAASVSAITDGSASADGALLGTACPGPYPLSSSSSSSLLHDMMNSLSSATGFHGPSYNDTFGAIFDKKDGAFFHDTLSKADTQFGGGGGGGGGVTTGGEGGNGGGGRGNDGLTRDFLGLRPLSHNEILNMAGLGGGMNTNGTNHGLDHESHESWQSQP